MATALKPTTAEIAAQLGYSPSPDWWRDTYRAGLLSTRTPAAPVEDSNPSPAPLDELDQLEEVERPQVVS